MKRKLSSCRSLLVSTAALMSTKSRKVGCPTTRPKVSLIRRCVVTDSEEWHFLKPDKSQDISEPASIHYIYRLSSIRRISLKKIGNWSYMSLKQRRQGGLILRDANQFLIDMKRTFSKTISAMHAHEYLPQIDDNKDFHARIQVCLLVWQGHWEQDTTPRLNGITQQQVT